MLILLRLLPLSTHFLDSLCPLTTIHRSLYPLAYSVESHASARYYDVP